MLFCFFCHLFVLVSCCNCLYHILPPLFFILYTTHVTMLCVFFVYVCAWNWVRVSFYHVIYINNIYIYIYIYIIALAHPLPPTKPLRSSQSEQFFFLICQIFGFGNINISEYIIAFVYLLLLLCLVLSAKLCIFFLFI